MNDEAAQSSWPAADGGARGTAAPCAMRYFRPGGDKRDGRDGPDASWILGQAIEGDAALAAMFADPADAARALSEIALFDAYWGRVVLATPEGPVDSVLVACRRHAPDGDDPIVAVQSTPVKRQRGVPPGARDLAARMHFFGDATATPAFYVDCRGQYRFANRGCLAWLSRSAADVLDHDVREVVGEDVYRHFGGYLALALEGCAVHFERHFTCTDGRWRWGRISYIPDIAPDGSVAGTLAVIHDLTDLYRNESRLAESERKLRLIAENVPMPIVYVAEDETYTYANPAAALWLGQRRGDIVGRRLQEFVPPAHLAMVRAALARTRAGERSSYERKFTWTDGSEHWARVTLAPDHGKDGRYLGAFLVLTDLTEHKQAEDALAAREKHFHMITDGLPAPVLYINQDWTYGFVNRQFPKWIGKPRHLIVGRPVAEVLSAEAFELVEPYLVRALRGEQVRYERTFTWHDRSVHIAEVDFVPDFREDGSVAGTFAVMHDITEVKRAQQELARAHRILSTHVENSPLAVIEWRPDFRITRWSGQAQRMFGWTATEALDRRLEELGLVAPADVAAVRGTVESLASGGRRHERIRLHNLARDGRLLICEWHSSVVHDDDGKPLSVLSLVEDITQRVTLEQRLLVQATRDALTGLANRQLFHDRLQMAIAGARRAQQRFALMFIDLDGFKHVNDTLGHGAGDQLLAEVARRFQHCVREADTLARIGGDEFMVILDPVSAPENAELVAAKLLEALASPVRLGEAEARVGASIGICIYPDDAADARTLMQVADAAMYEAKQVGKGRFSRPVKP